MKSTNISISNVPRETFTKVDALLSEHASSINEYLKLLLWWNDRVNLVSRDVPRETLEEHIRHSLLITELPPFKKASLVVDAGTGGGLPGLPLALVSPNKQFLLNDIVSKKIMAVRDMARKLELNNIETVDSSIEDLNISASFLLVSKHSFKLPALFEMVNNKPWNEMILYKGMDFKEELEDLAMPLEIHAYDLSAESDFYQDKALLFISRI